MINFLLGIAATIVVGIILYWLWVFNSDWPGP